MMWFLIDDVLKKKKKKDREKGEGEKQKAWNSKHQIEEKLS